MNFGSVCSGIEAASVAWEKIGWKAEWFSEIEKFPSAVLEHHYPNVPNLGDMTQLPEKILARKVSSPDILCGGTPCQSFSYAGKRNSLDDARGNLTLSFCDIANAIDTIRKQDNKPECIIFWENVPGVINTQDNAFGCFLGELSGEKEPLIPTRGKWTNSGCVFGPKRTIAWRVLDAKHFGLAQRRKRMFVVASAREGFSPAEILFEFDGMRRDFAPSRDAWKKITPSTRTSITFNKQSISQYDTSDISSTLAARDYKGFTDLIVYTLPGNWINRKPKNGGNSLTPMNNISPCLTKTDIHAVYCVHVTQDPCVSESTSFTLGRNSGQENVIYNKEIGVRRLTPIEYERLQGFPDDYTKIPWKNKPKEECPDSHRYKALGNSWAVPVVTWIGNRIDKYIKSQYTFVEIELSLKHESNVSSLDQFFI